MSRIIPRILRNNDFVRIFAICQICILICTQSVFAYPTYQGHNSAIYNFTLWSDFTTEFNNYYGTQQASPEGALLADILKANTNLRDYFSASAYAWNGSANGGYNRISTDLRGQLEAISYTEALIWDRYYTYSSGQSSLLNDIKTNTTNTAASNNAALTFLGSLENLQLKEAYNSTVLYDSRYSERYIRPGVNCSVSLSNGEFQLTNFNGTYPAQSTFTIPMYQNQYTFVRFEIYTPKVLTIQPLIYGNISDSFIVPSNSWITITSYKQPDFYGSNSGGFYISDTTLTSSDIVKIRNVQYISSPDLDIDKQILDSLDNLEVNVDINDSVNVTPISLDVQIGIDDFTEVNTISNKLRTWLSTGVGVSALIGALDQLDDSFFTLYNRNVIETINSGYTDFYD